MDLPRKLRDESGVLGSAVGHTGIMAPDAAPRPYGGDQFPLGGGAGGGQYGHGAPPVVSTTGGGVGGVSYDVNPYANGGYGDLSGPTSSRNAMASGVGSMSPRSHHAPGGGGGVGGAQHGYYGAGTHMHSHGASHAPQPYGGGQALHGGRSPGGHHYGGATAASGPVPGGGAPYGMPDMGGRSHTSSASRRGSRNMYGAVAGDSNAALAANSPSNHHYSGSGGDGFRGAGSLHHSVAVSGNGVGPAAVHRDRGKRRGHGGNDMDQQFYLGNNGAGGAAGVTTSMGGHGGAYGHGGELGTSINGAAGYGHAPPAQPQQQQRYLPHIGGGVGHNPFDSGGVEGAAAGVSGRGGDPLGAAAPAEVVEDEERFQKSKFYVAPIPKFRSRRGSGHSHGHGRRLSNAKK